MCNSPRLDEILGESGIYDPRLSLLKSSICDKICLICGLVSEDVFMPRSSGIPRDKSHLRPSCPGGVVYHWLLSSSINIHFCCIMSIVRPCGSCYGRISILIHILVQDTFSICFVNFEEFQ